MSIVRWTEYGSKARVVEFDVPRVRIPRIVQSAQLLFRPLEFLTSCIKTYGPVFELNTIGRQRMLYPVVDCRLIAELHDRFPDVDNQEVKALFGESALLCMTGSMHKKYRTILAQFFRAYWVDQAKLADHVRVALAALQEQGSATRITGTVIGDMAVDTVFRQFVFRGLTDRQWRKIDAIRKQLQRSMRPVMILEMVNIAMLRRIFDSSYRTLHRDFAALDSIINKIAIEDPDGESIISFLSRNGLSASEVRGFVLEICASTAETMRMGALWTLYFLATERREWRALKAAANNAERTAMIDRFGKEVLRLRPVTMMYDRYIDRDAVIDGFRFRSGGKALFIPYHLHQRTFDNPSVFDSDRFARSTPDKYAYMPFGSGHRFCPGAYLTQDVMRALTAAILDCDRLELVRRPRLRRYHLRYMNLAPPLGHRYVLA